MKVFIKDYLNYFCILFLHNFVYVFSYVNIELPAIEITRTVFSKGFHRTLQYNVTIPDLQEESKILVIENIPRDIFIDPYQTSQIKGPTVFKILGKEPIDTEAPAYEADAFQVFMCSVSQDNVHVIELPIHFRYQAPHQCSLLGDNTVITLKSPSVYIIPGDEKEVVICGQTSAFLSDQEISWRKLETVPVETHLEIPTGCIEHMALVTVSAVCALLISTYFLCYELWTLKIDVSMKA